MLCHLMVKELVLGVEILSTNIADVMLRGVPDMVVVGSLVFEVPVAEAAVVLMPGRVIQVLVKRLFRLEGALA